MHCQQVCKKKNHGSILCETCAYVSMYKCVYTLAPDCSAGRGQAGIGGTSREPASPSSRSPPSHLQRRGGFKRSKHESKATAKWSANYKIAAFLQIGVAATFQPLNVASAQIRRSIHHLPYFFAESAPRQFPARQLLRGQSSIRSFLSICTKCKLIMVRFA